jgi:hypothetical protein
MNEIKSKIKIDEYILWNAEANLDDYVKNHKKHKYGTVLYFSQDDATAILKEQYAKGRNLKNYQANSDASMVIYRTWNEFDPNAGYQTGGKDGLTLELQCSQGMFYAECFFDDDYEKDGIAWQSAECLPKLEEFISKSKK